MIYVKFVVILCYKLNLITKFLFICQHASKENRNLLNGNFAVWAVKFFSRFPTNLVKAFKYLLIAMPLRLLTLFWVFLNDIILTFLQIKR